MSVMHFVEDVKKATTASRLQDLAIPLSLVLKPSQVQISASQFDGCGCRCSHLKVCLVARPRVYPREVDMYIKTTLMQLPTQTVTGSTTFQHPHVVLPQST